MFFKWKKLAFRTQHMHQKEKKKKDENSHFSKLVKDGSPQAVFLPKRQQTWVESCSSNLMTPTFSSVTQAIMIAVSMWMRTAIGNRNCQQASHPSLSVALWVRTSSALLCHLQEGSHLLSEPTHPQWENPPLRCARSCA